MAMRFMPNLYAQQRLRQLTVLRLNWLGWRVYDGSMVACNLHLLAEDSGFGCCWIGFAHNIFAEKETKRILGIPEAYQLVSPVMVGYPAQMGAVSENPNRRKPFEILYL